MPPLTRLLAIAALVLSALVHVNALVANRAQVARHAHNSKHDVIAKRKRTASTCIPRPSSITPSSTPAPATPTSPAPTSTTPSTTTPSSAPSPASSPKKWGLAWGADPQYLQNFALSKVQYLYTWSPHYPTPVPSGMTPIPMFHDMSQEADFKNTVVAGYANIVFGFNEPNEPSQANMDPDTAASVWHNDIDPLKSMGYQLISPACTDDADGLAWYAEFFTKCRQLGCTIDAIAFHGYNTDAQAIIDYAEWLYGNYTLPIWITEFADQNYSGVGGQSDMTDVQNFANTMVGFIDNTEWIHGAFPFGVMTSFPDGVNEDNLLMDQYGNPTDLAHIYFG